MLQGDDPFLLPKRVMRQKVFVAHGGAQIDALFGLETSPITSIPVFVNTNHSDERSGVQGPGDDATVIWVVGVSSNGTIRRAQQRGAHTHST